MHVNRTHTRADHFLVVDIERRSDGSPILIDNRCIKTVDHYTTTCPECEDEVEAWIDDVCDEICPECGMVCGGPNASAPIWPEDASFQSRGGFEGSGFPALNDSPPRFSTTDSGDYGQKIY